jgi:serine/threonine protein kinase
LNNKLDNYQLIKNIGEGAFGSVNLAIDKSRKNKKVAIKQISILKTCQMNKERHVLRERDLLLKL